MLVPHGCGMILCGIVREKEAFFANRKKMKNPRETLQPVRNFIQIPLPVDQIPFFLANFSGKPIMVWKRRGEEYGSVSSDPHAGFDEAGDPGKTENVFCQG